MPRTTISLKKFTNRSLLTWDARSYLVALARLLKNTRNLWKKISTKVKGRWCKLYTQMALKMRREKKDAGKEADSSASRKDAEGMEGIDTGRKKALRERTRRRLRDRSVHLCWKSPRKTIQKWWEPRRASLPRWSRSSEKRTSWTTQSLSRPTSAKARTASSRCGWTESATSRNDRRLHWWANFLTGEWRFEW